MKTAQRTTSDISDCREVSTISDRARIFLDWTGGTITKIQSIVANIFYCQPKQTMTLIVKCLPISITKVSTMKGLYQTGTF